MIFDFVYRHELGGRGGGWTELFSFVGARLEAAAGPERVLGAMVLSVLADTAGERLVDRLKELLALCRRTLADPELEVAFYTVVTLTHLVRRTGSDEVAMFQQLIPTVLIKIEALVAADQEF